MRKKRILFSNEASWLSTGFSVYGHEVLKRLHATGKFEICELASYCEPDNPNDQRWRGVPWKVIPAMPSIHDEKGREQYYSNHVNQFGSWKFEEACLEFKPDVVCDIRDWWYFEHQERSPFRPFYKHAIMPTVDAAPQDEQWMSTFLGADAVFAYSDWGLELLRKQSNGRIKLRQAAPPGADLQTLKPVEDRRAHRASMGILPDSFIVGTVMRNQKRKLYPDIIQSFAQFLEQAPADLAKRSYLYMHTSWPDLGWDIPRLITEAGISHRCLFTYLCKDCGATYPSFFADAKCACRHCGQHTAGFPTTQNGVSRETLADILNVFDCYVQYANSEGFGMPQVEAAACGIPVFATDYSAMSDVVRKLNGYPLKVQRLACESETHCWRALPDNDDFVRQLIDFGMMPSAKRARKGYEARKGVEVHYDYDKTAKAWEDYFDSMEVQDGQWESPPRAHTPAQRIPENLSSEQFVAYGLQYIAGRPDMLNSYTALRMIRDLNWEARLPSLGGMYFNEASTLGMQEKFQDFNRDLAVQEFMKLAAEKNYWESRRADSVRSK